MEVLYYVSANSAGPRGQGSLRSPSQGNVGGRKCDIHFFLRVCRLGCGVNVLTSAGALWTQAPRHLRIAIGQSEDQ